MRDPRVRAFMHGFRYTFCFTIGIGGMLQGAWFMAHHQLGWSLIFMLLGALGIFAANLIGE